MVSSKSMAINDSGDVLRFGDCEVVSCVDLICVLTVVVVLI